MFHFFKNRKNIFYFNISVFLLVLFLIFKTTNVEEPSPEPPSIKDNKARFLTKKESFNACLKTAAKKYYNDSDKFFKDFSKCIKANIGIKETQMDFIANLVHGEKKVFLPMAEEYFNSECKWLTIGIGGSSTAESTLVAKYPNCLIYGVDPTSPGNFSKVGKVLPFGVGIEDSNLMLSVDTNLPEYEKREESVMALTRVLDEFVHSRLIHYLAIDIEGIEMLILPELFGYGKLAAENITFCQIDVELHNPKQISISPEATKINRVQWMLEFLGESSPYLPIYTVPYGPAHKASFINTVHPECEMAFKIMSYF